jgi:hypothetical protein
VEQYQRPEHETGAVAYRQLILWPLKTSLVIVMRNGVFGGRMLENFERCGGVPVVIDHEWGEPCDPNKLEATLEQHPDTRIVAFVHAETSTGALSDAKTLVEIAHKHGALTIVDAVTSLGGCPVLVDAWGIDAIYSASQKCLPCTPGLSPVCRPRPARRQDLALRHHGLLVPAGQRHALPLRARLGAAGHGLPRACRRGRGGGAQRLRVHAPRRRSRSRRRRSWRPERRATLHSFRPVRGKLGWGFGGRRPVAQPLCRAERNCRARC